MQNISIQTKPINPKAKSLIALLHGIGSDAADISMIVPYMQKALPDSHFIAINGRQRYDQAPFGFQWASRKISDNNIIVEEFEESGQMVIEFLKIQLESLDLGFENLFLVGFSQGAILSNYIATSFKEKLGGIISFAGAMIPIDTASGSLHTPVCFIHGIEDQVIGIDLMRRSVAKMRELGFTVQAHEIPNLTHSIDMRCIEIANNFILNVL